MTTMALTLAVARLKLAVWRLRTVRWGMAMIWRIIRKRTLLLALKVRAGQWSGPADPAVRAKLQEPEPPH
jgi:hypothetical protein